MKKANSNAPVARGMLDEAVETILQDMEVLFSKQDKYFDKPKAGQRDLQRQIIDVKYDNPTHKEFDALRGKVDKHHPLA